MSKDLTTSKIDRQNILNNELAVAEIQRMSKIDCILFEDKLYLTKEMVSDFFEVDIRTIERYISSFSDELKQNGYEVLKGKKLKAFLNAFQEHFGTDINVGTKITVLGVFDFRAFLNVAMLLSESENARILRQLMLDIVMSKGYLKANPLADIKNMGIKDKRVEFWTPEEYEKFAYYAMDYPQYYYIYEVLYWCGLRLGEMLALTLNDIDLDEGIISVTKTYSQLSGKDIITSPKTPSSVRKVSMPTFLCDELREYIGLLYEPTKEQRLFTVSKSKLANNFHLLSDEAGLKRITIHGLRHSHVSLLISKKYDIFEVSKRIGHKSVKTTQDIYGHLFDDVQKSIANDLDKLRRGA